jgi:hypothetical protein
MPKDKETQSKQVAPLYSDPVGTLRSEMDRLFMRLTLATSGLRRYGLL